MLPEHGTPFAEQLQRKVAEIMLLTSLGPSGTPFAAQESKT
jgi:hypothetical protein